MSIRSLSDDVSEPFGARLRATASAAFALLRALGGGRRHAASPGGDGLTLSNGRNDGPPDLDELWKDFNSKLSNLFGGKKAPRRLDGGGDGGGGGGGPSFQPPDMKSAGIGIGLISGVVALIWLGSGVYIVQEGQQAVVTTFGRYSATVDAGIQWRLPYPFQSHETVPFTQLRSVDIGRNTVTAATGLRDSSMLTQDENIVDIRFTVQYRLSDSRAYLFENRNPDEAVVMASESAVREIVGRSQVDSVLYAARDAIAADLVRSVQTQLDRLNAGILITNINIQNVQVPEQVQAAFNDAVRAGADRDRFRNEGEAYASEVIPRAQGTAARLREEAEAYRARIVATAEGDAQRFRSVLAEYQRAPAVTRDRLYIETMQEVYGNVSKVLVDSRGSSNFLYMPLEQLLRQTAGAPPAATPRTDVPSPAAGTPAGAAAVTLDARTRSEQRGRERDVR
jgi:membrane protease subunit HflK